MWPAAAPQAHFPFLARFWFCLCPLTSCDLGVWLELALVCVVCGGQQPVERVFPVQLALFAVVFGCFCLSRGKLLIWSVCSWLLVCADCPASAFFLQFLWTGSACALGGCCFRESVLRGRLAATHHSTQLVGATSEPRAHQLDLTAPADAAASTTWTTRNQPSASCGDAEKPALLP